MNDIVPRSQVTKHGLKGIGAIAGGAGLLVLSSLSALPLLGLIAGGALAVVGLSLTRTKSDRTAGIVTTAAGIVTGVSSLLNVLHLPTLSWLMWIPGIALLGAGIFSLVKFFRGMKSRS